MRRRIFTLAVAALAAAIFAAVAAGGVGKRPALLTVTGAEKSGACGAGGQAYIVYTKLKVANSGKAQLRVASARFSVEYRPGGPPRRSSRRSTLDVTCGIAPAHRRKR